ncbi:XRE family transcriptional regulator [Streptomyces sp. ZAF1911]|uniref:XRE family transcriptional regulator n=1 Tax=Streptomyces sp. ZAF1911 TaxID=2944129 RepID=UPI00237C1FCA|nr:XRE family transcriptional regulator [Streptomyces sp. ZAF1911]MDD9383102.1 XRE family transcriptional regulator [Streptomyces sp. ZAF1911]
MERAEFDAPPATVLAALLQQLGMRPEQLIARINERRARRGGSPLSLKAAYPWLREVPSLPQPDNQADALAVLTARAGRCITASDVGWDLPRPRTRHRHLDAPGDAPLEALLHEISQGDIMDRRNLLMLTGAAATAPALALLLGPIAEAAAAPSVTRLNDRLVGSIESAVRDLREMDDSAGSASGDLTWGLGIWQSTSRVVAQARGNGPLVDRLQTAYIELSEQVGWMLFDARQHPQAQRVYHTGMRLAREAGTSLTTRHSTANLVASAAYQAAWLNNHNDAAALLDIAARTPELPSAVGAVIAERRVYAAGRRHDPDAVRRFRDDALLHLGTPDKQTPWWATWLTKDAVDGATGRAWLACDQPSRAVPFLSSRVEAAAAYPRDRLLAVLDLADTVNQCGESDRARELLDQAGELIGTVSSQRMVHRHRTLSAAVAA